MEEFHKSSFTKRATFLIYFNPFNWILPKRKRRRNKRNRKEGREGGRKDRKGGGREGEREREEMSLK